MIGLTPGHIAKYETGVRIPVGMNLFDWATALGLHLCVNESEPDQ